MSYQVNKQNISTFTKSINIMLRLEIPVMFKDDIWKEISKKGYEQFIHKQKCIYKALMQQTSLFKKYFKIFYSNHQKLKNWSIYYQKFKKQIEKYCYRQLLEHSQKYYQDLMCQISFDLTKKLKECSLQNNKKITRKGFHRTRTQIFHQNNDKQIKQTYSPNKLHKIRQQQKYKKQSFKSTNIEEGPVDYHDLFVRTMNACDGHKYIYYNMDRHIQGKVDAKKYNSYIRTHKRNNTLDSQIKEIYTKNTYNRSIQDIFTDYCPVFYHQNQLQKTKNSQLTTISYHPLGQSLKSSKYINSKQLKIIKKIPFRFKKIKPVNQSIPLQ